MGTNENSRGCEETRIRAGAWRADRERAGRQTIPRREPNVGYP
jgi:hypothetical protein